MCKKLIYLISSVLLLGLVLSNVADATALPGLIGWYKLDEMSGKIASDSSGLGNDGNIMGTPKWVAGHFGGALDLNGSGNFVEINSVANDIKTNNFSVMLWIRGTDMGGNEIAIGGNYGGGSHDFLLGTSVLSMNK